MTAATHTIGLLCTKRKSLAVTIAVLLHAALLCSAQVHADETTDLARIIELNEEYAEATRLGRAGEITRAEMQARQKAVQAQARQIHSSYGATGTAERREWDRKVLAAKNAHTKAQRQEAKALAAEQRAAERAQAQAVAAEERAQAAEIAAAQAAEQRERDLAGPLVPVNLVVPDFEPVDALQQDALTLAPLLLEDAALSREHYQLNLKSAKSQADLDRISLLEDRREILAPRIEAIRAGYSNTNDDLKDLNLLAQALGGNVSSVEPEEASTWPAALQSRVAANVARETAEKQAALETLKARKRAAMWNDIFSEDSGTLALIVAIVVGIAMSFGAPRGIARLSADGATLRLAGWKYNLQVLSGVVLDSQQRTEERTLIQESGGHGTIVGGTGYITPRQEAVKDITTFDHLFIRDDEGLEHEVEMEDFDLRVRIGNQVSIVLADGRRGSNRAIMLYNDSTRKHFYSSRVLRDLLKPSYLFALFHAALVVIILGGLAFPLLDDGEVLASVLVTSFCLYWIGGNRLTVAAIRAGLFQSGGAAKALVRQVAGNGSAQPAAVAV